MARALELGYSVMRADTDVYFSEDPYPILRGPLFGRFEMVSQHDFFGARDVRAAAETAAHERLFGLFQSFHRTTKRH